MADLSASVLPAHPVPGADDRPSWQCLFDAGLTVYQAARLRLQCRDVGYAWASKRGLKWPADPGGAVANAPRVAVADLPPLPPVAPDQIDLRACRQLWCEVMLIMWRDVFPERPVAAYHNIVSNGPPSGAVHRTALLWFGSRDFHMVCALAGLDGSAVLDRFRARCLERGITP
jgi:hypothetical protein